MNQIRLKLLLAPFFLLLLSLPALATVPPTSQVIPESTPVPVTGLVAHIPGSAVAQGISGVQTSVTDAAKFTGAPPEPGIGRFLRFQAGKGAGGRLVLITPPLVSADIATLTPLSAGGSTVSFWYRHPPGQPKVTGWNPLILFGDDYGGTENWKHAIVLGDGLPLLARRGSTELFAEKAFASQSPSNPAQVTTNRLDDGAWHHLALRVARPGCAKGNCPQVDRGVISLFVDGKIVGEQLANLAGSTYKIFIGWLPAANAYVQQVNYEAASQHLNTTADIDDVYVYNAALSQAEIYEVRWSRLRQLLFQAPPVSPDGIGWTGPSPQLGTLPPSLLPSRPLGGTSPVDMLALAATTGGTETPNAALQGLAAHTFATWMTIPQSTAGPLWMWQPDGTSTGWRLEAGPQQLTFVCNATGIATKLPIPATADEIWHLLTVKANETGQTAISLDQQLFAPISCNAAQPAKAPQLLLARPALTRVSWTAVYANARPDSEIAAVASPGPSLWFDPPKFVDLLGQSAIEKIGDASADFSWSNQPGTIRRAVVTLADRLGGGASADSNELTLAMDVTIKSFAPNYAWFSLARRTTVDSNGWIDFELLAHCAGSACNLYVNVPTGKPGESMQTFLIDEALPLNKQFSVSIAWPLTRLLTVAPNTTGQTQVVVEPGVTLNGTFLNRRYVGDANKIVPVFKPFSSRPPLSKMGKWYFGEPDEVKAVNTFSLHNIRVYGRALDDSLRVTSGCASKPCAEALQVCTESAATGTAMCGGCDSTLAYDVGGASDNEHDCRAKIGFLQGCRSDAMCTTGTCNGGVCVATKSSMSVCKSECASRGRQCLGISDPLDPVGAFTCGGCLSGFVPTPGSNFPLTSPELVCNWKPFKHWAQECSSDAECVSGACRDVSLDGQYRVNLFYKSEQYSEYDGGGCTGTCYYNVSEITWPPGHWQFYERKQKVCLAESASVCEGLPWNAPTLSSESITKPDASTGVAYRCATGHEAPCKNPNYGRQNPVISGGACQAAASANPQIKTGECEISCGNFFCTYCEDETDLAVNDSPGLAAFKKPNGLTLVNLKQIFLGDDSPYKNSDYGALRDKGVGPLLIDYAGGTPEQKAAMVAKYGKFEPVIACAPNQADLRGGQQQYAYHRASNDKLCLPNLQPDGAACPPPNEPEPGKQWCRSNYCARDTKTCVRGDNPLEEVRGKAGSKNRNGKSAVKFGLVRVDDTELEMNEEQPNNNEYRYVADLSQAHVPCILGKPFPPSPLFEMKTHLDRSQGPACATTEISTFVFGFKLTSPKPAAVTGSCTGYSGSASSTNFQVCETVGQCTPVNPSNLLSGSTLAQMAIPTLNFCAPWEEMGLKLPELKKDFKEFLVPLYVSFGLTLDACISFGVGLDGQGLPQVELRPAVGVGVEAKGGVGVAETGSYEFGAGIRLALTLVRISFPITWAVTIADAVDKAGKQVLGLLKLSIVQKLAIELNILGGDFGLFAKFSIGPISFEWTLSLFAWTGFFFHFDLAEIPLLTTHLDFREQFANAFQGAAKPTCDAGPSSPCYQ